MKIKNFQSQVCVCAASTNLIYAKSHAEMEKKM
ncbi:MAG TPA: DNA-binding response regulator, partial [Lachnospiraceae bacterium]|nr:DNA-binding response regulator [Lachnospiraceae bacterium]